MTNQTVLITGASSGIGLALAKRFSEQGYTLILVSHNKQKLLAAAEKLNHKKTYTIPVDLSETDAANKVYAEVRNNNLSVSILVNNAGFGNLGAFSATDGSIERDMIMVNVQALTQLTKLFLPSMIARGEGKILNVASTAAFQPGPFMAVYYATKAYVLSFSEALGEELKNTGVSVTTLCPGPTETEFQKNAHIKNVRLFRSGVMSVDQVAEAAYLGLQKRARIIVPGMKNKLLVFLVRFVPRTLITKIIRKLQS